MSPTESECRIIIAGSSFGLGTFGALLDDVLTRSVEIFRGTHCELDEPIVQALHDIEHVLNSYKSLDSTG